MAVYSEADAHAAHVALADEAYCVGPAPSSDSYLRMDRIIEVMKNTGAEVRLRRLSVFMLACSVH